MKIINWDFIKNYTSYKKLNVLNESDEFNRISIYADDIDSASMFVAIDTDKYSLSDGCLGFTGNEDSVFGLGGNKNGKNDIDLAIKNGTKCIVTDDESVYLKYSKNISMILTEDCLDFLCELSRQIQRFKEFKIIAITGSVGKTTTTYTLYSALKTLKYKVIKGNRIRSTKLGLCLDILNTLQKNIDFFVFELQSDGIGQINQICQPVYAFITNIKNCHLVKFKNIENIFIEKTSVLNHMKRNGTIFIDSEDRYLLKFYKKNKNSINIVRVGNEYTKFDLVKLNKKNESENCFAMFEKDMLPVNSKSIDFTLCFLKYIGQHEMNEQSYLNILSNLTSNYLRYNAFLGKNGCEIVLDSYNGSFFSMKNGIERVCQQKNKKITLVLGSMLEIGNEAEKLHREIGCFINTKKNIYKVILLGESMLYAYFEIKKLSRNIVVEHYFDYNQLIQSLINIELSNTDVIYIKGSGGMRMELVAPYILAEYKK